MAPKKRKTWSKGATPPPSPLNLRNFITRATKENYSTLEGVPRNNPKFHLFLYNRRNWKTLCDHPDLRVAPVVSEFHANLHDRIGSTVFVRGVWVPFDSLTINRFFELQEEDSEEYRALYREPNYEKVD